MEAHKGADERQSRATSTPRWPEFIVHVGKDGGSCVLRDHVVREAVARDRRPARSAEAATHWLRFAFAGKGAFGAEKEKKKGQGSAAGKRTRLGLENRYWNPMRGSSALNSSRHRRVQRPPPTARRP
ncbi:hypothetical protein EYF80_039959 [Liparis tanakae]|uniref:Uncharacterized protein n=1 Tax=Liparis tanakae TaxID=230148 RepID=A0A4Z2G9S7_9TELE|nr:hypothetical protein EYF80_039959 [Liparis tanakae]